MKASATTCCLTTHSPNAARFSLLSRGPFHLLDLIFNAQSFLLEHCGFRSRQLQAVRSLLLRLSQLPLLFLSRCTLFFQNLLASLSAFVPNSQLGGLLKFTLASPPGSRWGELLHWALSGHERFYGRLRLLTQVLTCCANPTHGVAD